MNSELPPNELPPSERPRDRQAYGLPSSIIFGLILIVLGGYFLLQTLGILPHLNFNWWAIFILFPAFAIGSGAWRRYQANGERADREVRTKAVIAGLIGFLALSLMFDININFGNLWPLFLILAGIAILFGLIGPGRE